MLTLNKVDLGGADACHHGLLWMISPADSKTRSNVACVRRPVCVFRWLGWYAARSVSGASCHVPPWRKFGTGDGTSWQIARHVRREASIATDTWVMTLRCFCSNIIHSFTYGLITS